MRSIKGGQLALATRFGDNVEATASVLYQDNDQGDLNYFHSLRGMTDPPVALGELQKTERVDMFLDDRFLLPSLTVTAQSRRRHPDLGHFMAAAEGAPAQRPQLFHPGPVRIAGQRTAGALRSHQALRCLHPGAAAAVEFR